MADVNKPGISGQDFDKFVQNEELRIGEDDSKINKLQQRYWEAKQVFISKLKRKEDDCVVASDAPLDAKLELFRSIEDTCCNLLYILEGYQDRLCALAHEENSAGRFLKECGKLDKTRAGKVMTASGKTLCYTAQQRIQLRNPLVRLYQEVETFQYRAIADTMLTVERMEKARVAYRGALLWMKDLSQQLDPDTYKQLEKFRKVQAQVRRTKARFDRLKTDTQQKIDMLCASRCNMFSHALVLYQNSLSNFFERTAKTMKLLSENFKGYQHYEFSLLKDLTETSKKLTHEDGPVKFEEILRENMDDKDALIFFESEYTDEAKPSSKITKTTGQPKDGEESSLINFGNISAERKQKFQDLLDSTFKSENMNLLNDIFEPVLKESAHNQSPDSFIPSNLLDPKTSSQLFCSDTRSESTSLNKKSTSITNAKSSPSSSQPLKEKKSSWLDLFAELDPLSNPDALGSKEDQDRNC